MNAKNYSHKTLIKYSTLLFLMGLSVNVYADTAEIYDKIGECTLALNKANYDVAISASSAILKLDPNNREGFLCKGRALGAQGHYAEAVSALESAVALSEKGFDQAITYLFLGNLHKSNSKNTEAIAAYEKSFSASELDKNNKYKRISLNLMAEAQTQNNDLNGALASNLAGVKFAYNDNDRADSYERTALAYRALGQMDNAIEYQLKGVLMQQKAGTLDQYANASLSLGNLYTQAKDYANAEKTYNSLAKFSKDNGGAYFEAKADLGLAHSKTASGDTASAKDLINKAKTIAKETNDKALAAEIEQATKQ